MRLVYLVCRDVYCVLCSDISSDAYALIYVRSFGNTITLIAHMLTTTAQLPFLPKSCLQKTHGQ